MMQRYLLPVRRRIEIGAAVYAGGFGLWVWALSLSHGIEPLAWTGLSEQSQMTLGQIMAWAAFTHALGIRINGVWRYSPALRAMGMMTHAGVLGFLAFMGGGSTATYTYGWLAGAMIFATASAMRDLNTSMGRACRT